MTELIVLLISICFVIYWMVVFWRIMLAHEKLAESVERIWLQKYRQEQQNTSSRDD